MSKLAEVAERLAETRRWLDQEAARLAARLDQLEKRAPTAIQAAHRLVDEQLRGLDETERMVQQWLSATAGAPSAGKGTPQPHHSVTSPVATTSPKPSETFKESPAATLNAARAALDEQHQYVVNLERALQTMANEFPEPDVDAANRVKQSDESAAAHDSRWLLDEPPRSVVSPEEGGLESALQTLANMPRLNPFAGAAPPAPEPGHQKAEDASKQQPRKLGVVRVA